METKVSTELLQRIVSAVDFEDDSALADGINELRGLLPDTECDSCEIGTEGHEYDCPEAQE